MKRIFLSLLGLFVLNFYVAAQNEKVQPANYVSIHQLDLEKHDKLGLKTDAEWDEYNGYKKINVPQNQTKATLTHIVFGWHPYWMGSSYNNYQWDKLSDLAYFSYEVDYTDGSAVSTHSFETASVVDVAKSNGVRVHLTATLFSHFDDFFANSTAQTNLINNLVTLVKNRGCQGINIDFEGMGSDNKTQFTNFMHNLATELHNQIPGSILSVCLYAVDWNGVFDMPALSNDVDLFTIMGYDYYYKGSSTAGPTGQLYTLSTFAYNQARSIEYYRWKGAPLNKLVLGVPYYGYSWPVSSTSVPANTSGNGTSKTYKVFKDNSAGYYSNPHIDPNALAKYCNYNVSGTNYQLWIDDEETLPYHYKAVLQTGIAGIGIWALGYDDGYTQLWDLIAQYFTTNYSQPASGTIWDLGGPNRAYNPHEDYTYVIQPPGATGLTLSFSQFDVENNYDYLYIYDGNSTSASLIGKYTSTNSPGTINASGNALTLRFTSDGATQTAGFTATWNATTNSNAPTTEVSASDWATADFTASFTDNAPAGSITDRFYQVTDYNGTEWRANGSYGYLNDNFNASSINTEWTAQTGTWAIDNGSVKQSDDGLSNTNLWISATQNSSYTYLYSWKMKLSGTAGNRRGGIHFFCDDPTLTNRGNNYMVYYRVDNNKVQIYKYVNDSYQLKTDDAVTVNPDQWYDCKVTYNPSTGEIKAFMDGNLVSSWTDPSPYTSGNAVSLRTGNAVGNFDDFQMFKSRNTTATVTVGAGKEVRYQNPDPATAACQINSIVIDNNNVFSNMDTKQVNIDWSEPNKITTVNDGTGADIDVTTDNTQLSANWTASTDDNSGIVKYWYAIGTSQGATDVVTWTDNGTNTTVTHTGLSLSANTTYYFSVKAENGAGLQSQVAYSDGVQVQQTETQVDAPEWVSADFNVNFTDNGSILYRFYQVTDYNGTEWRSNGSYGYLNDDFDASSINSDWTAQTGTWAMDNGSVKQSDDGLSNTNLWISATQNSSYTYLYSWKMKLSGTAGNRRGGIHFFCDDATLTNRGNNYMVYYRVDNNKVQIYKYVNDSYQLKTDDVVTVNPDQWYDCKVTYNPSTGEIKAFMDGNLVSSWTDPSPYTSGNAVSLRTGNAVGNFDDFQMFKSRNTSATVTVGAGKEARYQSNSKADACRIASILLDNANSFSDVATDNVKVDWTAPIAPATINDGTGADEDVTTSTTQLSANWSAATEPNSGIENYYYSIGTTPGGTDIVNWTDNQKNTSVTVSGLNLTDGTTYYFNVKAKNSLGMWSSVGSSDGIKVQNSGSGCTNCPNIILY